MGQGQIAERPTPTARPNGNRDPCNLEWQKEQRRGLYSGGPRRIRLAE